jgi:4'-phosphopantetheinyl transferase EntD
MKPAPHIAALFTADAVAFETQETILENALLPEERQYVARAMSKRVQEFAAGRVCARAALAQLGYAAVALPMRDDRAPQWPIGATGSITHTDGFCAAVAASTARIRALGLDVEPAASVKPELWHRICGPEELQTVQFQEARTAIETATLIFSAKEAFYKCQHTLTGQWLGFSDISISITVDTNSFLVRPLRSLKITEQFPGPWRGRYLSAAGRVLTGVCII